MRSHHFRIALALLTAFACSFVVNAQSYPSKPLRIIVPVPAGGGSDIIGRIVAQKLIEQMKQQIVVDNRTGAGGAIGTEVAVRSAPDGYTLLLGSASEIAINPVVYSRLTYDPVHDLAPIALLGTAPVLIVVHPSLPVKNLDDLIALAKARPGDINMASAGNGTLSHFAGELFKSLTGVSLTHVPYKGGTPAAVAVLSGEAQVYFAGLPAVASHVKAGRLKAIAVADTKRVEEFPRVSTAIEAGVPEYEAVQWWGMFIPVATPKEIVGRLHNEIAQAMRTRDVITNFAAQGTTPGAFSQQRFADFIKVEVAKWGKVAKATGVKLD